MRNAAALLCGFAFLSATIAAAGDPPPSDPSRHGLRATDPAVAILRLEDRRDFGAELIAFLASNDPATRGRAAIAAGRIGDARAIDPLAALLHDRDPIVRAKAAFALGEIEDSAAAIPLALLLRGNGEREPHVRALAVEGLGKLRAGRFKSICVATLSDTNREVSEAAAIASWQMQASSACKELVRLAGAPQVGDDLRGKASYALMRMLGAAAQGRTPIPGGASLSEEARSQIRAVLLARAADPSVLCRLAAMRGLGSFADDEARGALRTALSDLDWRVRVEAVRALTSPAAQPAAADTGGPTKSEVAVDMSLLRPALEDGNPNVRIAAVEAMGQSNAVTGAIVDLGGVLGRQDLSDREREVASLALAARWKSMLETAAPAGAESVRIAITDLARSLAQSKSWPLRAAVPEILDPSGAADRDLLDRLLHDDPRVAKTAVEPALRLAASARPAGQSLLAAMESRLDWLLSSPDPVLRAITIEAAGSVLADSSYVERGADPDAPAAASDAPTAGSTAQAAGWPDWIALLARQWKRARTDRVNDETLSIVGQLERFVGDPVAQAILREALSSNDPQVRGQARRILAAKQLTEASAEPPIETGRSRAEYATILRWAEEDHQVEIRTSRGAVRIRLLAGDAPLTCWNFVRLAESGFYDRGRWHRIVPDFVAQDGCPRGDGYGGPGYAVRCEINEKRFVTGAVGMALSGKDTGGSQFFICHSPQPHLDGRYTVFGQVVDGMDVVDRLIQGDPIESIRPVR